MPHRSHRITTATATAVVVLSSSVAGAGSVDVDTLWSSPSVTLPAATAALAPSPAPPALVVAQAADAEVDVSDRDLIRSLQQALAALGFDPGPVDGLIGRRTRAAVQEYQRASGLPDDGRITRPLLAGIAREVIAARQPETAAPEGSEDAPDDAPPLSAPSAPAAPRAPARDG